MGDLARAAGAIPRVRAVEYAGPEYMVSVVWDDGREEEIDLAPLVFRYRILRPLRRLERFAGVGVAEYGYGLAWPPDDDLEIGPEQLAELAAAQRAPELRPSYFRAWMAGEGLTQEAAARLLHCSKRTIADYAVGKAPIGFAASVTIGVRSGRAPDLAAPEADAREIRAMERRLAR